ncbi:hypothetical protein EYF80_001399 [Liparis tanakae]|uniref:Uncharacterized protein n=1 Tax=Liparis tanakae TaxID=230148 RepID=A0A4Z2JEH6_9TELE|nr:hypothetical protein EYF80_001399 [Liparis tanakae]
MLHPGAVHRLASSTNQQKGTREEYRKSFVREWLGRQTKRRLWYREQGGEEEEDGLVVSVQRKGKAGFCGWLDVDQSKAERNHSLMESAQHDFMFFGASAKGRERQNKSESDDSDEDWAVMGRSAKQFGLTKAEGTFIFLGRHPEEHMNKTMGMRLSAGQREIRLTPSLGPKPPPGAPSVFPHLRTGMDMDPVTRYWLAEVIIHMAATVPNQPWGRVLQPLLQRQPLTGALIDWLAGWLTGRGGYKVFNVGGGGGAGLSHIREGPFKVPPKSQQHQAAKAGGCGRPRPKTSSSMSSGSGQAVMWKPPMEWLNFRAEAVTVDSDVTLRKSLRDALKMENSIRGEITALACAPPADKTSHLPRYIYPEL